LKALTRVKGIFPKKGGKRKGDTKLNFPVEALIPPFFGKGSSKGGLRIPSFERVSPRVKEETHV